MSLNWQDDLSDAEWARSVQGLPSEESMVLYPSARSLLESQALLHDDKPFIRWLEGDVVHSASYAELYILSKQAANYLRLKEITFGQRVIIEANNSLDTIVKYLGLWMEGAVAVPAIGEISRSIAETLDPFPEKGFFDLVTSQSPEYKLRQKAKLSDDMIIFVEQNDRTIALSHNNVLSSALSNSLHIDLSQDNVVVCPVPIGESFGFIAGLLTAAYAGTTLALCRPEPKLMVKIAAETDARWMLVNSSLLRELIDHDNEYRSLLPDGLQFISPAEGLTSEIVLQILDRLGCQIITGYHSTECSSFATLTPISLDNADYKSLFSDSTILPVGSGLQTSEADIHDDVGSPVPDKENGNLTIRGHTVMQRYVGDESGTNAIFKGGWLHTGREGYKITIDENNVKFFLT